MNIQRGVKTALTRQIAAVGVALAAGDDATAGLDDFLGPVASQRGKKLSVAQADDLTARALELQTLIGC